MILRHSPRCLYFIWWALCAQCAHGLAQQKEAGASGPGQDGTGAFATGKYRKLLREHGHTEKQITEKIDTALRQLFHGDTATQAVYLEAGKNENGPLAYVSDVPAHDIRSEGMSYGMMIAVQLDKKREFDAIWNYALTYMYLSSPEHPAEGYFSWSLKRDGTPNEETPAPDGEEYFVMALYFADPSYHLPAFYELWARWGPEADRLFWAAAADTSRAFFQKATNPHTGLAPDYANFDGTPFVSNRNRHSAHFSFDSWRTAGNWSVDWAWWGKDKGEQVLSDRIQDFFASKGIGSYGDQFTLEGETLEARHATGLVATTAVAGLAATAPHKREFVEELWNEPIPQELVERDYDCLLHSMNLVHYSGRYRIWVPK